MKEEILNVLKQKNNYVSGQELADMFNVSRTAVWKAITSLKKEGYAIESVSRLGYRLDTENDILNERELDFSDNIYFCDILNSTNNTAKKMAVEGCREFLIVTCNKQENGKGRLGRTWISPYGENIYLSMVFFPDIDIEKTSQMTLVFGIAAAETLKNITGLDVKIKWPNDLIVNGRKVAGILTEMQAEIDRIIFVVSGIGINVNQTKFDDEIKDKATSLFNESGKKYKRSFIIKELAKNFQKYYAVFLDKGFGALRNEYKNMCINTGREVKAVSRGREIIGKAVDISENGELVIKNKSGELVYISSGEAGVRGLDNKYI